jgi:hypothetical protein
MAHLFYLELVLHYLFENWAVGSIFILLGIMLKKEND